MQLPHMTEDWRLRRIEPPRAGPGLEPLRMVPDTDTYNEVDDQFAVVYALRSTDRLQVEALYAETEVLATYALDPHGDQTRWDTRRMFS